MFCSREEAVLTMTLGRTEYECIDACAGTIRVPASHREAARRAAISSTPLSGVILCVQALNTCLHHAAQKGHINVVQCLLKEGANIHLTNKVSIGFWCIELIL